MNGPADQVDSASVSSGSTSTGGRDDPKQAPQGTDRSALLAEIIQVDSKLIRLKIAHKKLLYMCSICLRECTFYILCNRQFIH